MSSVKIFFSIKVLTLEWDISIEKCARSRQTRLIVAEYGGLLHYKTPEANRFAQRNVKVYKSRRLVVYLVPISMARRTSLSVCDLIEVGFVNRLRPDQFRKPIQRSEQMSLSWSTTYGRARLYMPIKIPPSNWWPPDFTFSSSRIIAIHKYR